MQKSILYAKIEISQKKTFPNSRYRPPVVIIIFFIKSTLCKNNAISKVLNKLQVSHFHCTIHTNTTPTV